MPINATPRSVSDATRFTPTTPHASSKAAEATGSRFSAPSSRTGPLPSSTGGGGSSARGDGSGGSSGGRDRLFQETPEQKVARLRAAHLRAKAAQVSKLDKVVDSGRRFFDTAHKVTVMGLIGFTVLAGFVTVYTAVDMITYNSKRKAEFIEAQKKMEADSLEAARLAYMTGKATQEQISLVEEAMERERATGQAAGGSFFSKMPNALSKPNSSGFETSTSQGATQKVSEAVSWPSTSTPAEKVEQETKQAETKKGGGLWAWMTSSLKKEEEGDDIGSSQKRLGWDSLSEEDDATGVRDSDLVRAVEERIKEKESRIVTKAHEAFEKEKENQRKGGPLDRVGLEEGEAGGKKEEAEKKNKKGWFW